MRLVTFTPATRCATPSMLAANPFAMLEAEMNRLFGQALTSSTTNSAPAPSNNTEQTQASANAGAAVPTQEPSFEAWIPVEINEDAKTYQLQAPLPGIRKEDISVSVLEGVLNLKATRQAKTSEGTQTQAFARSITLSEDVDVEGISATHDNGLLTLSLPKREQAKPRTIAVN